MKKIIYGVLLIAAAVLIILASLDMPLGFIGTVPVIDIALSALLVIFCIRAVTLRKYWRIPFYPAIIFMLLEEEIAGYLGRDDGNIISNWTVLLCAVLLAAGIGFITSHIHDGYSVKLSAQTRYIDGGTFTKGHIKVSLGSAEVHFENAESYKGDGVLDIDCSLGNLEIFVPSSWMLETDIKVDMGNVDVAAGGTVGGPLLTIKGTCDKGNVMIHRA